MVDNIVIPKLEGSSLLSAIGKFTARAGRKLINKSTPKQEKEDAKTALLLLNHAQGLVNIDDKSARRLLSIAKRAL